MLFCFGKHQKIIGKPDKRQIAGVQVPIQSRQIYIAQKRRQHRPLRDPPGKYYNYDGNRYIQVGTIIEAASGKSIRDHYIENIIRPLEMSNSAPAGSFSFWDELFYMNHGYGLNEFDHVY